MTLKPFKFLRAARSIEEQEVDGSIYKIPVEVPKIKQEFANLINDKIDSSKQCTCSRWYQTYKRKYKKGKGKKFDKESFFLYLLENEIKFSKLDITKKYVYKDEFGPAKDQFSIIPGQKIKNLIKHVSVFIKKELPEINSNPERIKSKLWRFKKSGIMSKIKKTILSEKNKKSNSGYIQELKERRNELRKMEFIYKVADFIRQRPEGVYRQKIFKRFSNKRKEDLGEIEDILKFDCGIEIEDRRNETTKFYKCIQPGFFFAYYKAHQDWRDELK